MKSVGHGIGVRFSVVIIVTFFLFGIVNAEQNSTPSFFIRKIILIGNRGIIPPNILHEVITPYENKQNTLQTLKECAATLADACRLLGYGYLNVIVPKQVIEHGVVQLEVIGRLVGNVTVQGDKHYSQALIRAYIIAAIKDGRIDPNAFEKALTLLGQFPDFAIKYKFSASSNPQISDLLITEISKEPLDGQFVYNNYENPVTGRDNVTFGLIHGNLTGRGDALDISIANSFAARLNAFVNASYTAPTNVTGNTLTFSYSDADFVGGRVFISRGNEHIFGLTDTYALTQTRNVQSNFSASFYYKNGNQFVFNAPLTGFDRLRELGFGYSVNSANEGSQTSFDATVTNGLGTLLGGMGPNDPLASRVGVSDSFVKFNAQILETTTVFSNGLLILRGEIQLAPGPLSVLEQYAIGGESSVRGYLLSAFSGDDGWNLSAELRVPINASHSIQATTFLDEGGVTLLNSLAGEAANMTLLGTGVGLHVSVDSNTAMQLEIGFPVNPPTTSTGEKYMIYGQFSKNF